MPFDVTSAGPRRVNGMRNFRQALASPHSVLVHDSAWPRTTESLVLDRPGSALVRCPVRRNGPGEQIFWSIGSMKNTLRFLAIAALAVIVQGCALSLRNPDIADLQRHPGRYTDRTVSVSGVVTSSWGVPLVPFRFYKVDDGTGEVTVLSQSSRMPGKGERVRVKGKVQDVAVLGGRAVGLHIREDSLHVKR
jgi:hypothetical protein